jgi:hypothetical protein
LPAPRRGAREGPRGARHLACGLALATALSACSVPIAHFTAIGDASREAPDGGTTVRVHGESCRWWILGVTLGLPRIEEAVDDALAHAGTTGMLRDVDLVSFHPFYGWGGKHCYVVEGTVVEARTVR